MSTKANITLLELDLISTLIKSKEGKRGSALGVPRVSVELYLVLCSFVHACLSLPCPQRTCGCLQEYQSF